MAPKSLSPRWEGESCLFECEDAELQDETLQVRSPPLPYFRPALAQFSPVQLRVMDYDTYSANDAIGRVYIGLGPLIAAASATGLNSASLAGWLPILDTIYGPLPKS